MSLKLGGLRDSRVSGLASPFNSGIQHITHLDLGVVEVLNALARRRTEGKEDSSQDAKDIEGSIEQAQLMVRLLLEGLPRNKSQNKLETFL